MPESNSDAVGRHHPRLVLVSGVEREVCADIEQRQQAGIQKYGATVATNPAHLLEWLQHAYEECLDKAIYLKRAMRELESAPDAEEELDPLWDAGLEEEDRFP